MNAALRIGVALDAYDSGCDAVLGQDGVGLCEGEAGEGVRGLACGEEGEQVEDADCKFGKD